MTLNRKIRIGLGIAITIAAYLGQSPLYMIGIILIVTGVFNLCPSCNNGSCEIETKEIKSKSNKPE